MIQGAQGWCTGMTQWDGTGKEVGGGFRMGNTCTLMVDSSQCIAKPIQYCKVKLINLKKEEREPALTRIARERNESDLDLTTWCGWDPLYSM